MENKDILVEEEYNVSKESIWKALTDKDEMKQWYFELSEFKPKVGFKFEFTGEGNTGKKYLHLCEVKEVVLNQKISYSWTYQSVEGFSLVSFEILNGEKGAKLKLTHEGVNSFPENNPDMAIESFSAGWNHLLKKSLKSYLE